MSKDYVGSDISPRADHDDEIDLIGLIKGYLKHWPIYVACLVICLGLAWLYGAMQRAKYPVNMSILFVDQKDKSAASQQIEGFSLMEIAGGMKNVNVDNEIELLKSREILRTAVNESRHYVKVTSRKGIRSQVLYEGLPFRFTMTDEALATLDKPFSFTVTPLGSDTYNIEVKEKDGEKSIHKIAGLPATLNTTYGVIAIDKPEDAGEPEQSEYSVEIIPPLAQAIAYSSGDLKINRTDKSSSVARLSILSENRARGEYFLETLINVYNRTRAMDKDAVARKQYDFITERIAKIGGELTDSEVQLENVKRSEGVTSFQDLGVVVDSSVKVEMDKVDAELQLNLMNHLIDFVKNEKNNYELIPNTMGVKDATLSSAITTYNEMIFRRNQLAESGGAEHPTLIALDNQIAQARKNVREAAEVAAQGLNITLSSIRAQGQRYQSRIANAPSFERISNDIMRQKEIRSSLYLMLLKKREETSIELASSAETAKVVDRPLAAKVPTEPKKSIIYLAGLILGLLIPTLIIFLWKLTRKSIYDESDVKALTNIPIIGSVPVNDSTDSGEMVVKEGQNDTMAEIFRKIRTNIDFVIAGKDNPVIMVTSTIPGEGKTFIASNLAMSFATLGKKVLLLGMDIRNPQLKRIYTEHKNSSKKGLTDLLNDSSLDPHSVIQETRNSSFLKVIHAGTIPPNPAELLSRTRLEEVIDQLKERFEYIIIDSAPVGPVVDTIIANRVADVTIYLTRIGKTERSDFDYINYMRNERKLKNMYLVINGLSTSRAGYGKSYGYGYYGKYYGKQSSEE